MINVIVVDDEEDIQFLFEEEFHEEIEGMMVSFHFELSGQGALDYLSKINVNSVYCVVTDISMPGMSGLELLEILKDRYPDLRVFIITASLNKDNYEKAKSLGSEEYLVKPIKFDFLRKKFNMCNGL